MRVSEAAAMAAEKPAPVRVLYLGVCGLPAEYCEFGPDFERCKLWLRAHAPGVYPEDLLAPSSSGVMLSDASKKLGKKFATGASVIKGPTEKEQIDVQGDISYDIAEFITDTWPDELTKSSSIIIYFQTEKVEV